MNIFGILTIIQSNSLSITVKNVYNNKTDHYRKVTLPYRLKKGMGVCDYTK